ncbi:MAG TPA: hypothetical protein VD948_12165, partial [Rhodothermales bacterium]|nr:hypothetical protein [Rhodothermales bacterium]
RPVSTLLFVLLLVAIVMVVIRRAEGPPVPEGFIVLKTPERAEAAAFRLDDPARIIVDASGSVGDKGQLEAYAWLIDATSRRVMWRMSRGRARRAEGTRVVQRDTVRLPAGTYEVFFTPHGQEGEEDNPGRRIFDRRHQWRNDAGQWYVVLRTVDAGTQPVRIHDRDTLPEPPRLVWRTDRDVQGRRQEAVLEAPTSALVHAQFVSSEIGSEGIARIERLSNGSTVWEAQASAARPAGGAPRNRRVEADVPLAPGLYRIVAKTPGDHGPGHWQANPPDDPRSWGLTLTAVSGTVRPLELWTGRTPLIRLRGDRADADMSVRFAVSQAATLAVYGMGEITEGGAFDYASLVNETSGTTLWEMDRGNTTHAGGDYKNREGQQVLTLEPGTYLLRYRTDGSHHLGDFNDDPPSNPERYGTALFLLGPPDAIRVLQTDTGPEPDAIPEPPEIPEPPPAPLSAVTGEVSPPPSTQGALAAIVRMGDNERQSAGFTVRGDQAIRIYATGEFSGDSDFDSAWITNARGETVWRMADARLRHAGGDDRNRYCDEVLRLPPGNYIVHYTTDNSHAFGNFGDGPPAFPEAWGVIVTRAGR